MPTKKGDEADKVELSCSASIKAILANCKSELVKTLSECSLNLLRSNVKLTPCQKRKLRKYRTHLRKLEDKRVSLTSKKKAIVQRRGFLLPLLGVVANYRQPVIQVVEHNNMLRKMYLVARLPKYCHEQKQHHVTSCQGSESPKGRKETYKF